ncbi:MAG: DUF983 domain-containing protein [Alphaproteobacteria bacterium]|nr:DUF983 domain-containing protein [Alphaproteobacteria bacterium]
MASVSPLSAGMRCRCPDCGEGQVFCGFLKFKARCDACGADLSIADAGDGPAFFVMFAALVLIVPAAMLMELAFSPPTWVHVVLWPPVTFAFCLALLRPFKATLFALQWRNKAGEAKFRD